MPLIIYQVQIYEIILIYTAKIKKLGSKSLRLLLFGGEVEMFGHFCDERIDFDIGEFEDSEGIDPVIE